MMHGHEKSDLAIVAVKPTNKARKSAEAAGAVAAELVERRAGTKGNAHQQSTYRTQNRLACHRRWSVYGNLCRHTPKVGAVCGKAARTDLGGGRAMKFASLPLLKRREFITLLGGAATYASSSPICQARQKCSTKRSVARAGARRISSRT